MRTVVARFLLLRFAGIFVFVLFTLTSLLVLFDLLAQADDLALHHEETLWPLAAYAGLRLPVLLTMIIPMSALLAALVTFERLASQYELVALQSAGVSMYQVSLVLLAGGLAVAGLHFTVAAQFAVPAEARLFRWAERDYVGLPGRAVLAPDSAWFDAGRYQVHIDQARDEGRRLDTITVIERDNPNAITTYYEAREARHAEAGWELVDGWKQTLAEGRRENFARLILPLPLEPEQVMRVRLPLSSLGFDVLRQLRDAPGESGRPSRAHYETWLGRRLAEPLGTLIMLLLAAPLGLQLKRSGHQMRWGALGLGLGFLFFIAERVLAALGENGVLPPGPAAWGAIAVFGFVGVVQLITLQK